MIYIETIYIEILIFFILVTLFIFWVIWFYVSKFFSLRKYKKSQNDKTGKGGVFNNGRAGETEPGFNDTVVNFVRPEQPEGQWVLQEKSFGAVRKNCNSPGENGSGSGRNRFKRLFKRHKIK